MSEEEIIIINNEPFYRILNGTNYDYAPIPKEFKPYFERLEQEITKLKGVIETYEILIKANNMNNWDELKKWLKEKAIEKKENEEVSLQYFYTFKKMQELENKPCHTTLE